MLLKTYSCMPIVNGVKQAEFKTVGLNALVAIQNATTMNKNPKPVEGWVVRQIDEPELIKAHSAQYSKAGLGYHLVIDHDLDLTLRVGLYPSDQCLAVTADYWNEGYDQPWGNLTVNLGITMKPWQAFLDTNNMPYIGETLERIGLADPVGCMLPSGFCHYPLYEFNPDELAKYDPEGVFNYRNYMSL